MRIASVDQFILAFGEHEFFINRQGTAFVTADQFALLCLVRVLGVIRAAFQTGRNGFSLVFVQCNQSGCCWTLVPAPIFAVLPSRTRTSPERTFENSAAFFASVSALWMNSISFSGTPAAISFLRISS